jgi:hypothetical protein
VKQLPVPFHSRNAVLAAAATVVMVAPTIMVVMVAPTIMVVMMAPTIMVVMMAPTIMVVMMAPLIGLVFTALLGFLMLFTSRAFHQALQLRPFFLTETLQDLLHVGHFLTVLHAVILSRHHNASVFIAPQFHYTPVPLLPRRDGSLGLPHKITRKYCLRSMAPTERVKYPVHSLIEGVTRGRAMGLLSTDYWGGYAFTILLRQVDSTFVWRIVRTGKGSILTVLEGSAVTSIEAMDDALTARRKLIDSLIGGSRLAHTPLQTHQGESDPRAT